MTRVANQVPVASDKVLVKIEEVVGVEGGTIEFAGRLVLLLHHKPRCLLGNDLCNDRPRCWFVLVWEIGTGTDVPSNRWMAAEDLYDGHVIGTVHVSAVAASSFVNNFNLQ